LDILIHFLVLISKVEAKVMATIQEGILEDFYKRLEENEEFTKEIVDQLRALFESKKKPKATDLARVLSDSSEGNLP